MSVALAAKLKAANEKLSTKQAAMAEAFAAAGEERDFSKAPVLTLLGAKTSAEAIGKIREMNAELETVGKERDEIAELKAIDDGITTRKSTPVGAPAHPGGTGPGGDGRPRKSTSEMVTDLEAWKNARQSKDTAHGVVDVHYLRELKTLFQTSAGWAPESVRTGFVVDKATRPMQVTDIIPAGTTGSAAIVYMEETTRTSNAAERAEGGSYAEDAYALTQRTETVRSIGTSIPVTDEQLDDVEGVQSYLDNRLQFGIRQRIDQQILTGDGVAPNLTGFLVKSGVQTYAKTGGDSTPDAIYKAMTLVRVTGRAFPNAVILHPNDWQDIRLLRTTDGIYIWGSPSEAGPDRIWGIQSVLSDAETENTGLVGDFLNFSQLFERKGLEIAIGYAANDFLSGKRTIRATIRVAFAIYRAAAFCTVTGI